jgi:hypothetical protein
LESVAVAASSKVEVVLDRHADEVGDRVQKFLGELGLRVHGDAAFNNRRLGHASAAAATSRQIDGCERERTVEARIALRLGQGCGQRAHERDGEVLGLYGFHCVCVLCCLFVFVFSD